MRILFVIYSMQGGGAERTVAHMANYWAAINWEVCIATLSRERPFYELSPQVKIISLDVAGDSTGFRQALANNLRRLGSVRRVVKQFSPDAVISVMDRTNVRTILATRGLRVPVIVHEQVDPASYDIGKLWTWLRHFTYGRASAIVVLTARNVAYFPRSQQRLIRVIPNPAVIDAVPAKVAYETGPGGAVVAMGRCVPQKGFDLLLQAFQQLACQFPDWNLEIIGDGPDRPVLQQLAADLAVDGRVNFLGLVERPMPLLAAAELFVMSSRFEGFPLALCEAMACGLPVVSFDCPTGPREIIRDGVDGILVPPEDIGALASAMRRLLEDPDLRRRMGRRATEVTERFGLETIMGQWQSLLDDVVRRRVGAQDKP